MRVIKLFGILTLILLTGCSTTKTMNRIMSSWEGEHIDKVVAQWGYPDEEKEFRGKTLYIWQLNKSVYVPQSSTTTANIYGNSIHANTATSGGYVLNGSCTRILEVDKSGYVSGWQWGGNNCPFTEWPLYTKWRNKNKLGTD
jgi:hypothetical protein